MKLVEIPIQRFQPETPLNRDTYLFLPLNNKTIRIGLAGESISESLLARLLSKGHTHLRINEESNIDPDNFPVHLAPQNAARSDTIVSEEPSSSEIPSEVPIELSEVKNPAEPIVSIAAIPASEEPAQSFSPLHEEMEISKIKGGASEEEPDSRHSAIENEDETESRFSTEESVEEESRTISGKQEEEERYVRKFTADQQGLPAVVRLQGRLAEKEDGDFNLDLSSEKESALNEAKAVILSSKISEKIISLSEQARAAEPGLRNSLRGQIRNLKEALDLVDAGDLSLEKDSDSETKEEITAIAESLASASRAEQIQEVSERLSAHALTRELAIAAIDEKDHEGENDSSKNATGRALPMTVSRLAAYLGHSLGYSNVDFLADLACGAIAHFAKKEGASLNEDLLPSFAKRIISSDEPSKESTLMDAKDILVFLDAYISDKECDRSHRDLMKRVFERTLNEFAERDDAPSVWSLKKWSSFVECGPTMDSHSICTRASAKAIKCARSATR